MPEPKKRSSTSSTQRTLKALRAKGFKAEVVERWIPLSSEGTAGSFARAHFKSAGGYRKDAFGFMDILALDGLPGSLAIQACGATGFSAHLQKIDSIEEVRDWLAAGNRLELWSWRQTKREGKSTWEAKAVPLVLSVLASPGRIVTTYEEQAARLPEEK